MPPRYPHGLKKSPFFMTKYEAGVLGLLGLSVGAGVYDLITSPWGEEAKKEDAPKDDQRDSGSIDGVLRKE